MATRTSHTYAEGPGSTAATGVGELLDLIARLRPSWQAQAACRGQGPERWFPERGESVEPARAICAGCPVIAECGEFADALPQREMVGIWAGRSGNERRRAGLVVAKTEGAA